MRENLGSRPESSSHLSPKDSSVGMEDSTSVQQGSDTNSVLSTTIQPERCQNDPGVVSIVDGILDNSNAWALPTDNQSEWEDRLSPFAAIEARTQNNAPFPTTQTKPTRTRRRNSPSTSLSLFTLETMDSASINIGRPKKRPRTG